MSVDNRAIGGRSSKTFIEGRRIKYWLTFSLGIGCSPKWGTMMLQRRSWRHVNPFTTYKKVI
ncbi:hypothetical protein ACEQPO_06340 [Bacillus sp. SL00103]